MTSKTWAAGTVIDSPWLQDVNDIAYGLPLTTTGEGASLVGLESVSGLSATTVQAAIAEISIELAKGVGYNILRDIPAAEWAAIIAGTSSYDVSTIVRTRIAALGAGGRLYFPGKKYVFSTADGGAVISAYMRISVNGFTIIADPHCRLTFTDAASTAGIYVDVNAQLFRLVGGLLYGTNSSTPAIELLRISAPYPIVENAGFAFASICLNYLGVSGTGVYVGKTFKCQFSNADQYIKVSGTAVANMQFMGNTYGTTAIGTTLACVEIAAPGCDLDDYFETQNHAKVAFKATTGAQNFSLKGKWLDSGELLVQTSVEGKINIDAQDCYHSTNLRFVRIDAGATADFTGSKLDGNGSGGGIFGVSASGTLIYGGGFIKQFGTGLAFAGIAAIGHLLISGCSTGIAANSGASGEGSSITFSGNTTDATLNAGSSFALIRRSSTANAPAAAGTVTPNVAAGEQQVITLPAGNITMAAPTNPFLGARQTFVIIQDATGGRTITWNAVYKKAADGAGGANGRGSTSFVYDGTNWVQQGGALAYN